MFAIIYNPVSGKGNAERIAHQIEEMLKSRGQEAAFFPTVVDGDGVNQARAALNSGCTSMVCIGGDGTISEIVGAAAGADVTLYIVPTGTGNDFARVLNLPSDPFLAFCRQLDGAPARIDCGKINGRPFLNVAGSGFDVEVLRAMEELKKIYPGPKAYRKAVFSTLEKFVAFEAEVSIDGGAFEPVRATIIEIANGRCIGGGMRVAPGAQPDDGLFDVVIVNKVPRWSVPFLLPLFIIGAHVHLPIARVVGARRVVMRSPGMVVEVDGQLEQMDQAEFEIMPGALKIMRPA